MGDSVVAVLLPVSSQGGGNFRAHLLFIFFPNHRELPTKHPRPRDKFPQSFLARKLVMPAKQSGLRVRKPGLLQPRGDCYFAQTIKGRDQFRRYAGAQCRDRRLDERRLRYLE
jgi:hypothetical protein